MNPADESRPVAGAPASGTDEPALFRAEHREGYSPAVLALANSVWAVRKPVRVAVTFAEGPAGVATREGTVAAQAGDAIVTGVRGESWPVGRERFDDKYAPLAPTESGDAGTYVRLPRAVLAAQLDRPFTVVLSDGESRLNGRARDWLVDHGDGSLGVVALELFPTLYEVAAPEVAPGRPAFHEVVKRVLLVGTPRAPVDAPLKVAPPQALAAVIEQVMPAHRSFNAMALRYGHRYRSAFWGIYLLSALAVLCAVLPFALGWNDTGHPLHAYALGWGLLEVAIIVIVVVVFWLGHRHKWQGEWLAARSLAELAWYLPLLPPLMDDAEMGGPGNWYVRLFGAGTVPRGGPAIDALCQRSERAARTALDQAASDPGFIDSYARWATSIFEEQRRYQRSVMLRERALRHRVHSVTAWLFALTAAGALAHLVFHANAWLVATTFLPALGASLHGALAQSESFRLEVTAERLVSELSALIDTIERARASDGAPRADDVLAGIRAALRLLVEEHRDWQMLVRPHRLPLG